MDLHPAFGVICMPQVDRFVTRCGLDSFARNLLVLPWARLNVSSDEGDRTVMANVVGAGGYNS